MERFVRGDAEVDTLGIGFARGIAAGGDQDLVGRHIAVRADEMNCVLVLQHRAVVDDDAAGALNRTAVVAVQALDLSSLFAMSVGQSNLAPSTVQP